MKTLLIILLVAWLVIAVVGFVVEALLWLAVIGLVLFALTVLYWVFKARSSRRKRAAGTH